MRASEPSTSGARAGGPGGKSTSLSPPYPRCSTGGSRNLGAPTGTGRAGGWVVQVAGRPRLRGLARSPVFTAEKAASREQPRHGNERQGWGRLRGKQENDAGKGGNLQAHLSRLAQMSSRAVERCGVRTARISDPQRGSPAPRHPARGRSECEGQRAEGRRWGGGARRTRLTLRSSCAHRPPAACSPTAPGLHLASSHSFWGGESGGEWREVTQARTT